VDEPCISSSSSCAALAPSDVFGVGARAHMPLQGCLHLHSRSQTSFRAPCPLPGAFSHYPRCRLYTSTEQSLDRAVFASRRRVGKLEVGLFDVPLSIEAKREILDGNRIASKDPFEHGFKNFARFGPDRHTGLSQSGDSGDYSSVTPPGQQPLLRADTATDRRLSPRSGIGEASLARCSRRTPAEGRKTKAGRRQCV
jgi:hypothetical protein